MKWRGGICADPQKMYYPEIAEKAFRLKHEEKERGNMAGVMEALLEEREREVRGVMAKEQKETTKEFALALLQDGTFSKEKITKMTKLELAEVEALAEQLRLSTTI